MQALMDGVAPEVADVQTPTSKRQTIEIGTICA